MVLHSFMSSYQNVYSSIKTNVMWKKHTCSHNIVPLFFESCSLTCGHSFLILSPPKIFVHMWFARCNFCFLQADGNWGQSLKGIVWSILLHFMPCAESTRTYPESLAPSGTGRSMNVIRSTHPTFCSTAGSHSCWKCLQDTHEPMSDTRDTVLTCSEENQL